MNSNSEKDRLLDVAKERFGENFKNLPRDVQLAVVAIFYGEGKWTHQKARIQRGKPKK